MAFELKKGYWDIYLVILLSTIFTLLVLILPDLELVRIILGVLFLLLFPGYVTISVIWPMKYDVVEDEIKGNDDELLKTEINSNEKKDKTRGKTIDGPTRLVLSVGLSLGITPVIGFIFNELYPLNQDFFGLRLVPILLTIYLYIMVVSGLVIWRREQIPFDKRLTFSYKFKAPFDESIQDKLITTTLIILIIISAAVGVYLYKYYHENDKFTEFYILGLEKRISDYPKNIFVNEEKMVYLGINNKEFESVTYEIRFFLNSNTNLQIVNNLNNIVLGPNSGFIFTEKIVHNGEFQSPLYFKINQSGKYDLKFQLIKDNEVYRELILKIVVFNEGDMIVNNKEGYKFYLLSPYGQPGGFPSTMDSNYSLKLHFGIENLDDIERKLNISISPDDPQRWYLDNDREFPLINNTGYYFYINLEPRRTSISAMQIIIPKGSWTLYFNVNGIDDDYIKKEIYVH